MALVVDVSVLGIPELERKLKRLESRTQKKVVRQAVRESAKRTRDRVVENLSGAKVNVQTGTLRRAFKGAKIRAGRGRNVIRVGIAFPERDELGIDPGDPYYYPTAVEYGHRGAPPYPYLRPAIDEHKGEEYAKIGRDIGKGIEREAGR